MEGEGVMEVDFIESQLRGVNVNERSADVFGGVMSYVTRLKGLSEDMETHKLYFDALKGINGQLEGMTKELTLSDATVAQVIAFLKNVLVNKNAQPGAYSVKSWYSEKTFRSTNSSSSRRKFQGSNSVQNLTKEMVFNQHFGLVSISSLAGFVIEKIYTKLREEDRIPMLKVLMDSSNENSPIYVIPTDADVSSYIDLLEFIIIDRKALFVKARNLQIKHSIIEKKDTVEADQAEWAYMLEQLLHFVYNVIATDSSYMNNITVGSFVVTLAEITPFSNLDLRVLNNFKDWVQYLFLMEPCKMPEEYLIPLMCVAVNHLRIYTLDCLEAEIPLVTHMKHFNMRDQAQLANFYIVNPMFTPNMMSTFAADVVCHLHLFLGSFTTCDQGVDYMKEQCERIMRYMRVLDSMCMAGNPYAALQLLFRGNCPAILNAFQDVMVHGHEYETFVFKRRGVPKEAQVREHYMLEDDAMIKIYETFGNLITLLVESSIDASNFNLFSDGIQPEQLQRLWTFLPTAMTMHFKRVPVMIFKVLALFDSKLHDILIGEQGLFRLIKFLRAVVLNSNGRNDLVSAAGRSFAKFLTFKESIEKYGVIEIWECLYRVLSSVRDYDTDVYFQYLWAFANYSELIHVHLNCLEYDTEKQSELISQFCEIFRKHENKQRSRYNLMRAVGNIFVQVPQSLVNKHATSFDWLFAFVSRELRIGTDAKCRWNALRAFRLLFTTSDMNCMHSYIRDGLHAMSRWMIETDNFKEKCECLKTFENISNRDLYSVYFIPVLVTVVKLSATLPATHEDTRQLEKIRIRCLYTLQSMLKVVTDEECVALLDSCNDSFDGIARLIQFTSTDKTDSGFCEGFYLFICSYAIGEPSHKTDFFRALRDSVGIVKFPLRNYYNF